MFAQLCTLTPKEKESMTISLIKIVALIKSEVYGVSLSSWQSANMPYLPTRSSPIRKECALLSPFINMETKLRKVKLLIIIRR